eukprot:scaffold2458_cov211-Chaetoceros_neogracile.AAC.9
MQGERGNRGGALQFRPFHIPWVGAICDLVEEHCTRFCVLPVVNHFNNIYSFRKWKGGQKVQIARMRYRTAKTAVLSVPRDEIVFWWPSVCAAGSMEWKLCVNSRSGLMCHPCAPIPSYTVTKSFDGEACAESMGNRFCYIIFV